jgi:hypothetical protein
MKFQVGKFTCEILLDADGKIEILRSLEPPKYLNRVERDQYQAAAAGFLAKLEDNGRMVGDDRNLTRLNGSG